jgi:hypothetical protein
MKAILKYVVPPLLVLPLLWFGLQEDANVLLQIGAYLWLVIIFFAYAVVIGISFAFVQLLADSLAKGDGDIFDRFRNFTAPRNPLQWLWTFLITSLFTLIMVYNGHAILASFYGATAILAIMRIRKMRSQYELAYMLYSSGQRGREIMKKLREQFGEKHNGGAE